MPLAPGTRLGPYEIVAAIGARQFGGAEESTMLKLFVTDYRDDGAYAYWYWKRPTTMFVVSGMQAK